MRSSCGCVNTLQELVSIVLCKRLKSNEKTCQRQLSTLQEVQQVFHTEKVDMGRSVSPFSLHVSESWSDAVKPDFELGVFEDDAA